MSLSLRLPKQERLPVFQDNRYLLVHDWMPSLGGSENVFQEICGMYEGVVVSSLIKPNLFPWLEERQVVTSRFQKLPFAFWKHYLFAPFMPRFYRRVPTKEFDVVLVDSHSFAHHLRAENPGATYVCYYHTSARSLWNPEIDDRATAGRFRKLRSVLVSKLKRLDLEASRNPGYLIANSKTTADRIYANYGRRVNEIIYPPVNVETWLDVQPEAERSGFLMWGRLIGYKKVDVAIRAAKKIGAHLNIVGAGPLEASLRELAGSDPNIVFHGRLTDHELKKLMAKCLAVLFPAYEDFGIVPVESMAAGLPVIAYGKGGAAETVSGYGLLLETQDVEELAQKNGLDPRLVFRPRRFKSSRDAIRR